MGKLFIITIFILTLFSCIEETSLKIGVIGNFSSDTYSLSNSGRNGAIMAVEEINSAGGIDGRIVELLFLSHNGSKEQAYNGVKKLIEDGAQVIIGPYLSEMARSVIASSLKGNHLVISPTVTSDKLSGKDDNFVRLVSPASSQGRTIGQYMLDNGETNVLAIADEHNKLYSHSVIDGLKDNFGSHIKVNKLLLAGALDSKAVAEYIKTEEATALFFITSGTYAAEILKECRVLGITKRLYGASWAKNSNILELARTNIEGMIFVDIFQNSIMAEKEDLFFEKFGNQFQVLPTATAMYTYEAIYLYKFGVEAGRSTKSESVKYQILNKNQIEGISDTYNIDPYGDANRPLSLFKIEYGGFKIIY